MTDNWSNNPNHNSGRLASETLKLQEEAEIRFTATKAFPQDVFVVYKTEPIGERQIRSMVTDVLVNGPTAVDRAKQLWDQAFNSVIGQRAVVEHEMPVAIVVNWPYGRIWGKFSQAVAGPFEEEKTGEFAVWVEKRELDTSGAPMGMVGLAVKHDA